MKKETFTILTACVAITLLSITIAEAGRPRMVRTSHGRRVPSRLLNSTHARPLRPTPDPISYSTPVRSVSNPVAQPAAQPGAQYSSPMPASYGGGYPQTGAPLYPSPTPGVPTYVGGTYITSHALSPHEMLYPHTYRSMYGPFYWKVKGKWVVTPFGVRSHDRWELQGTEVTVKYRDHYKLFSGFHPPSY